MPVDPVVSLLVGALGAALLGLLGAWIHSRREHSRWIREQRLSAYLDFVEAVDSMQDWRANSGEGRARLDRVRAAIARLRLLGPDDVSAAAGRALSSSATFAVTHGDENMTGAEWSAALNDVEKSRDEVVRTARRTLGIRDSR